MESRGRVEDERRVQVAAISPGGVLLGEWIHGLQRPLDLDQVVNDVWQGLALIRGRQSEDLELVPAVLGE